MTNKPTGSTGPGQPDDPANISDPYEQLAAYRARLSEGGGAKAVAAQHAKGKLTAQERLGRLLDANSFVELDAYLEHQCTAFGMEQKQIPGDGVLTGYGRIDGKPVYVSSQDFTRMGGSVGLRHATKIATMVKRARQNGVPFVQLNDSGGARIQEGLESLEGYGRIFYENVQASGVVPQLSVVLGPCAGGAVYSPAITDFIIMVDQISNMFVTGPQVIRAVTGEEVTAEALGGAGVHNAVSGVASFFARDEQEALALVRRLLGYLPANNRELPPRGNSKDAPDRETPELDTFIPVDPRKPYEMRDIIRALVDDHDFFEVQPLYAPNLVVGFARLANYTVGIVANQPNALAGVMDINASDKGARFIRFCDAFNIPLVTLVDVPGFMPGVAQEHGGIIRHGAKMLYAYAEATVPKLSVVVRKAFGGAFIAFAGRALSHDLILAWPSAEIAVMGAEGAANIIFKSEIDAAPPEQQKAVRQQKIDEYRAKFSRPYLAAKHGFVNAVIAPRETRWTLVQALEMTLRQRKDQPERKHGNIPL